MSKRVPKSLKGLELIVFAVWLFPVFVLCCIMYGYFRSRFSFRVETKRTSRIIIQITTLGNHNIVNRNISVMRSYNLAFPHEIWIVTESTQIEKYEGADKVISVPSEFKSISKYKARALDYSSKVRDRLGIGRLSEVKILFLDDDTIPSKEYMEKCQLGDYDIMEGILQPKLNYGTRYSYVENMRTLACLTVCAIYQSHGHPVWVHGEGMCVRASTEQQIGWAYDLIASEDLVFGHECSTGRMKWGFIWEPIYTTAPWNFRDFFVQRKRWFWGNVNAISRILSWQSEIRMICFYLSGVLVLWISLLGIILDIGGRLDFNSQERLLSYVALLIWLGTYGYVGYLVGDGKIKHIICSILLAWYTSIMNTFPICIGFFTRKPPTFEVIRKEKLQEGEEK